MEKENYTDLSNILDSIGKAVLDISEVSNRITESLHDFFNSDAFSNFCDTFARTSDLSEDERQRLISTYEMWGCHGWTPPPDSNFRFLDQVPRDENNAADIMMQFRNNEYFQNVFMLTRGHLGVNEYDYEEAISCFNNRLYKACCLILFSLIDGVLIRLQNQQEKAPLEEAKLGTRGINYFSNKLTNTMDEEPLIIEELYCYNISSCLKQMYKRFNQIDWSKRVINRNLLMHGAMQRQVDETDAMQLFFLYYNILEQYEILQFIFEHQQGD